MKTSPDKLNRLEQKSIISSKPFVSCHQCQHMELSGFKNWGECLVPTPLWGTGDNMVWFTPGHPQNFAEKGCELFVSKNPIYWKH